MRAACTTRERWGEEEVEEEGEVRVKIQKKKAAGGVSFFSENPT